MLQPMFFVNNIFLVGVDVPLCQQIFQRIQDLDLLFGETKEIFGIFYSCL